MIIRSEEKIYNVSKKKNVPVWVLDTDKCVIRHFDADTQSETEKCYSSDHIRYHLNFSVEYHKERLRKLVDSGEIVSYLDDLDAKVSAAIERQVENLFS